METLCRMLEVMKAELGEEAFRQKYVINEKDFTRTRKMTMKDIMLFVLCNTRTVLSEEIYNFCRKTGLNEISADAMTKSRSKIDYKAFEDLLKVCNTNISKKKTYKEYQVLAVDGMRGELPKTKGLMRKNSRKHNLYPTFHAVITYDVINQYYAKGIFEVGITNERKRNIFV